MKFLFTVLVVLGLLVAAVVLVVVGPAVVVLCVRASTKVMRRIRKPKHRRRTSPSKESIPLLTEPALVKILRKNGTLDTDNYPPTISSRQENELAYRRLSTSSDDFDSIRPHSEAGSKSLDRPNTFGDLKFIDDDASSSSCDNDDNGVKPKSGSEDECNDELSRIWRRWNNPPPKHHRPGNSSLPVTSPNYSEGESRNETEEEINYRNVCKIPFWEIDPSLLKPEPLRQNRPGTSNEAGGVENGNRLQVTTEKGKRFGPFLWKVRRDRLEALATQQPVPEEPPVIQGSVSEEPEEEKDFELTDEMRELMKEIYVY